MRPHAISETDQADEPNPYQAPQSDAAQAPQFADLPTKGKKRLYVAWFFVFALNLIVPALIGWQMTEDGGRIGMLAAGMLLLAVGYWICAVARQLGFALVVGGVAVALSQVFPILQMTAGIVSCALAEAMGLYSSGDDVNPLGTVAGDVGSFALTLITGGLLMAAALAVGLALRVLRAAFR